MNISTEICHSKQKSTSLTKMPKAFQRMLPNGYQCLQCFFFCSIQDPYAALVTKYPLLLRKLWDKSANIEASVTRKETVFFGGCLYF